MDRLTHIAEKLMWALIGAVAFALINHFVSVEESTLEIVTNSVTTSTTVASTSGGDTSVPQTSLEIIQPSTPAVSTTSSTEPSHDSGLININTATLEELMTLNGIGEVKAQAIIDYRNQYDGFISINELLEVSGIGEKTLDKIRAYITV